MALVEETYPGSNQMLSGWFRNLPAARLTQLSTHATDLACLRVWRGGHSHINAYLFLLRFGESQ